MGSRASPILQPSSDDQSHDQIGDNVRPQSYGPCELRGRVAARQTKNDKCEQRPGQARDKQDEDNATHA